MYFKDLADELAEDARVELAELASAAEGVLAEEQCWD
jgi:hypothetical protein